MKQESEPNPEYHEKTFDDKKRELVRYALAAKEAGDFKKEMSFWMEASTLHLQNEFEIDKLTTIESVHLRDMTEQVIKEQAEQVTKKDELQKEGDRKGAWLADLSTYGDLDDEIIERWLFELYGITRDQIPGEIDGPFKEYLRRLRENAHKP